ncbi:hypothetical protein PBT90_01165 [Algoriphagus halophytocola]|uniref:Lipoprotein n=1 Tax=Algoriphagus halophytocola TaxID=2991499 RepID=A0ABY6ME73_9BACT|nr:MULTISPECIES: hypothetical protein [unclassified Algoriphagus]UZD22067.1 hypothetical protein OM944_15490 [Algoriphagus sp. TR-M5]WBL43318.1 hypothetical protein PBT90_01165 [Algoriphagus sp. TR-M9]
MKSLSLIILLASLLIACQPKESTPDTLPMKVAMAYGFDQFDKVNSIAYTWNVQVDSARVVTRDWKWNIKDRTVYYATPDTSYTYSLDTPKEEMPDADKGFINDKYWLMYPFQLAWDSGYEYETEENVPSPISGEPSTKLTIVYNSEDGYTPGDAYDLYLDENNMILEWVFRRGNGAEGRPFTWDNVEQFGPIKMATTHENASGQKFIWFTNISVN